MARGPERNNFAELAGLGWQKTLCVGGGKLPSAKL
jgi:hypothetical protein